LEKEGQLPKRRKTCGELGLEDESLAQKVREAEQKVKKFEKHLEDLAQNLTCLLKILKIVSLGDRVMENVVGWGKNSLKLEENLTGRTLKNWRKALQMKHRPVSLLQLLLRTILWSQSSLQRLLGKSRHGCLVPKVCCGMFVYLSKLKTLGEFWLLSPRHVPRHAAPR